MRSFQDAAPADIEAIKKRALRSYAMGRITEEECGKALEACTDLNNLVTSIMRRENDDNPR